MISRVNEVMEFVSGFIEIHETTYSHFTPIFANVSSQSRDVGYWQSYVVFLTYKLHNLFFWFLTEEIQYHDGLRSRELGQAPILLCAPNS